VKLMKNLNCHFFNSELLSALSEKLSAQKCVVILKQMFTVFFTVRVGGEVSCVAVTMVLS